MILNFINNLDQRRIGLVLLLIGIVLYFPALSVGYLSDDIGFLLEVKQNGWNAFSNNFGDKFFIPVSHLIGLLMVKLTSASAPTMHLIQILLHVYVAVLLYELISIKKTKAFSVSVAIIFLMHPFQTEAVVWLASKSYVLGLLFSLLALKWCQKDSAASLIFSTLFLLLAMLSKESTYVLPFVLWVLMRLNWVVKKPKILYAWFGVLGVVLIVRWIALGTLIGGYGTDVHLNLSLENIGQGFIAYSSRFFTVFYGCNWMTIVFASVIGVILLSYLIQSKFKWEAKYLSYLLLSVLAILPVFTLESGFVFKVTSSRYLYFLIPIVAFGWVYLIYRLNTVLKVFGMVSMIVLCFGINLTNQMKWIESAKVRNSFLKQLEPKINPGEEILLLNLPDEVQGVLCLRNATEDYMRLMGKDCNIEIVVSQNFKGMNESSIEDRLEDLEWDEKNPDKVFYFAEGRLVELE